jgi:parallel beta-helix repeat protein
MFGSMALFAGLALLAVQPAAAATSINSCPFVIATPGQYRVANNLVSTLPGACITIMASDVHLNLVGHTITGPTNCQTPFTGVFPSTGILVGAFSNVHINNGTVGGGFSEGIRLNGTTDSDVNSMLVTANCLNGIHLVGAMRNSFHAITVQLTANPPQHCAGYRLDNSNSNVITSNKVVQNGEFIFDDNGIELFNSNSNTIQSSTVSDTVGGGIQLFLNSDSNVVRSNTVTNNRGHGILAAPTSDRNLVDANTVTGSAGSGIKLDALATFNTVQANTASGNTVFDGEDVNPACDNNTWQSDNFGTRSQPCVQ